MSWPSDRHLSVHEVWGFDGHFWEHFEESCQERADQRHLPHHHGRERVRRGHVWVCNGEVSTGPQTTPRNYAFLPCGQLDFESAVAAQNVEFKSSFIAAYSRLLKVKTLPRNPIVKAGVHVRKPRVNRDDASTGARSFFLRLRLRRPGSHVAYACVCACACVVRVNQPLASTLSDTFVKCNLCTRKWSLNSRWNFISTCTELHVHATNTDQRNWRQIRISAVSPQTRFRAVRHVFTLYESLDEVPRWYRLQL